MGYVFHFEVLWRNASFLLRGLLLTLVISATATLLALCLGVIAAVARESRIKAARAIATTYVEVIRNTPLLVQLWFVYFGLGEIGVNLTAVAAGTISLAFNAGAYTAEIIRAGLLAVEGELKEAAASLGMTPLQRYRYVILPIALRAILPALSNQVIQNVLASSLLAVLGVDELTNQATRLSSRTLRVFEVYSGVAVMYLAVTLLVGRLGGLVEGRLSRKGTLH
jgi:polar amino acid transport system permease protein